MYVDKIPSTASINELHKITPAARNSSYPHKGSFGEVNSLVPKVHVLDPMLQRLCAVFI